MVSKFRDIDENIGVRIERTRAFVTACTVSASGLGGVVIQVNI